MKFIYFEKGISALVSASKRCARPYLFQSRSIKVLELTDRSKLQ
jgi:hypothetical protein